ncbi:MAG: hypothetical protein HY708_04325, partial [Ignavibacteriae bacterium]|nr:hypothetical protein [Ignavibacteriota bacterium]
MDVHVKRNSILILTLLVLTVGEVRAQGIWISTGGPSRGLVNAVTVNPVSDVFAGTSIGGVQRLLSGSTTWSPANSGLFDSTVNAIAVLPNGVLFAGLNPGGYRSTDNGNSWISIGDLSDFPVIAFGVKSSSELFAGMLFNGAYHSTDSGLTWSQTIGNETVNAVVVSPTNGNVFAAGEISGILRSTTGEPPWIPSDTSLHAVSLTTNEAGHIFAGVMFAGVYRTTDNGTTWQPASVGLPSFTTVRSLVVNGTGHVFAATDSGVFRSTNNGSSWFSASSGLATNRILSLGMGLDGYAYAGGGDGLVYRSNGTTLIPPSPLLVAPPNGAGNQPTVLPLRWGITNLATLYHLQVSTDPSFTSLVVNDSTLVDTSRLVGPLLNSTIYHWRARAGNSNGWSLFSPSRTFTTIVAPPPPPILVSPPNGAVNQPTTLSLSWNASSGATSYRLQVSADSTFATTFFDDSTLAGTSQVVGTLANGTRYFWRVNAKNIGGTSTFSSPRNFTTIVAPPPPPILVSPPNGAVNQPTTLSLSWNASSGATSYRLQVSADSTFATTFFDDS